MEISRSKEDYAAFCATLADLPLCCQPWYLNAVAEGGQWSVVLVMEGTKALAALPYFHKHKLGLHYVTMPLFTKYMGILPAPEIRRDPPREIVNLLLSALPKLAGIDQQFSPLANTFVPLLPESFQTFAYHTHRLQLGEGKDWRAGINRNMRRNIRKADAALTLKTDLDLSTFYQINALSFTRQGLSLPYSFAQLERHDQALAKAGRRQIFTAIDAEERIHSVAYLMWDQQAAYYHLSGDDPELRNSGSGIWLIAQALDFTQQHLQLPIFDFEGSMIPAIAAIREQFGATKTTYYRVQQQRSMLYRALKWWRDR